MSAMTADVRDRILGLLTAGPATVARLAAGLGVPGGVVSYELKLLERDGLVRVGTTRREHGVPTPVYVSTAAAAPPSLPVPAPIPNLTWIGDDPYPAPLWTVPHPPASSETAPLPAAPGAALEPGAARADPTGTRGPEPSPAEGRSADRSADDRSADDRRAADRSAGDRHTGVQSAVEPGRATADRSGPAAARTAAEPDTAETSSAQVEEVDPGSSDAAAPAYTGIRFPTRPAPAGTETAAHFPRPRRVDPESTRGPRLHEVRRVPMDDATFYEFAERLDALAREFAARATPGAPPTELTILLTRPGTGTAGYGS
jgi:hypothetical protein